MFCSIGIKLNIEKRKKEFVFYLHKGSLASGKWFAYIKEVSHQVNG